MSEIEFIFLIPVFLVMIGLIIAFFGLKYTIQEDKEDAHVLIRLVATLMDAFLTLPITKNSILIFCGTILALMGFGFLGLLLWD